MKPYMFTRRYNPRDQHQNSLRMFENKVMGRISGPKREKVNRRLEKTA
jgi:hypothetical protein